MVQSSRLETLQSLAQPGGTILFVVLDGVGDLPIQGKTALERAKTPNLDALAQRSDLGLIDPVDRSITPGSGLGHLSLFGYDVYEHRAERGVLEALGVGLEVPQGAVAVRCNFVTLDAQGNISDRRAGRIPSEEGARLVEKLADAIHTIDGTPISIRPIKEYRFSVVLGGQDLTGNVSDTDPQKTGVPPLQPAALDDASQHTAQLLSKFVEQVQAVLADEPKANGVTLRGIGGKPAIPTWNDLYGLNAVAVANYPMYLGVAKLIGMDMCGVEGAGEALTEKIDAVIQQWPDYDLVFLHIKKTDSYGEDGDQDGKVNILEAFDAELPRLLDLQPDVVAITGDHSTPAAMKAHSWHPVPALVSGPYTRTSPAERFTESGALTGTLGRMRGKYFLGEILAQAGRLKKFGA